MGVFRKLSLLLWKNFTLRKKHYIVTALEIVLPTVIAFLVAIITAYINSKKAEALKMRGSDPYSNPGGFDSRAPIEKDLQSNSIENDVRFIVSSTEKIDLLVTETTTDTILATTGIEPVKPNADQKAEKDSEKEFLNDFPCAYEQQCIVAYSPSNSNTNEVIQLLQKSIDQPSIEWIGYSSEAAVEAAFFKTHLENSQPFTQEIKPPRSGRHKRAIGDRPIIQAAIIFETPDLKGPTISYKIRTSGGGFNKTVMESTFPSYYDSEGKQKDENFGRYKKAGFISLQLYLDKAIIKYLTGKDSTHSYSVKGFPYPDYMAKEPDSTTFDSKLDYICFMFTGMMSLGFIFLVPSVMRGVVVERQTGIKEFMKLSGIQNWLHWTAWLINSMILSTISATIVIFFLFVPFNVAAYFPLSNAFIAWVVLILYLLASTSFCFFVASFFRKPTIAITFGIILWIVSYWVPASLRIASILKTQTGLYLTALLPNMALHLAFNVICGFEAAGSGASFNNLNTEMSQVKLIYILLLLIFDAIVYLLLAQYVEAVLPSDFGVRKPWYFIFMPSTYCEIQKRNYFFALPVPNNTKGKTESKPESEVDGNQVLSETKPEDSPAEVTDNKTEVETEPLPVTVTDSQKGVETEKNSKTQVLEAAIGDKSSEKLTEAESKGQLDESIPGFETEIPNRPVGVEIKNLRKVFGRHQVAVAGVSMKMYQGEIFALLGHNGAGKTTTMSCCVGMMKPTSGTAIINGYDIRTDMERVREHLGLCPQHNLHFDELTVDQHLKFFGRLKGVTSDAAKQERDQLLWKLQLTNQANTMAKNLSGGQKRKLSLGIALIGNARVVFLDEPTSGMDLEARRAIWNMLLSERGHRTIILSTHFMEEADILSDRIAIMGHGHLLCCGTALFLKKFYGAGYTLNISTVDNNNKKDDILAAVKTNVPDAYFETSSGNISEMVIILPMENLTTAVFPGMFKNLSNNKDRLGIQTVGLSLTTMDEVFVKASEQGPKKTDENNPSSLVPEVVTKDAVLPNKNGSLSYVKKDDKRPESASTTATTTDIIEENIEPSSEAKNADIVENIGDDKTVEASQIYHVPRKQGLGLVLQQFWGLIIKRMKYTLRKWSVLFVQVIIPIVLLIISIIIGNELLDNHQEPKNLPDRKIKLDAYKDPVTLFRSTDKDLETSFKTIVGKSAKLVLTDVVKALEDAKTRDSKAYQTKYIVAEDIDATNIAALFSHAAHHSSPLALNLASNTLLNKATNSRISVTNHPFNDQIGPFYQELCETIRTGGSNLFLTLAMGFIFAQLVPIGLALLAASFIVAPIEEKQCKGKQLQLMTSVHPIVYWGSYFFWDYFIMIIVSIIMVLCFVCLQDFAVYTAHGGWVAILLIFLVYGFAVIPFSYLLSFFCKTVPGGFSLVATIHAVAATILPVIALGIGVFFPIAGKIFQVICRILPTYGVSASLFLYVITAFTNAGACGVLPENVKQVLCDGSFNLAMSCRRCCENCAKFQPKEDCFRPVSFLTWNFDFVSSLSSTQRAKGGSGSEDENEFGSFPGIGQEILFMFFVGVMYHILVITIEMGLFGMCCKKESQFSPGNLYDEDVLNEATRVENLVMQGNVGADALVVANLSKSYGSFLAVSNVSFGVHHGECFGLLGVNGAGKTTTFRMLTGDEIRSYGNAYAGPTSLSHEKKKFHANVGYCPQFDGQIGILTGREMVELFGRLRGLRSVHQESKSWLEKVGLKDSADVQCGKYSGGMKRRLSAAMAMVGDPEIVLLDEPTTGVDPISRRDFWKIIVAIRESGRAVILTSHSMDEISACCSRLGIMVNGQFQCFGSVQHLKSKFAQGFCLSIKLTSIIEQNPEAHSELLTLDNEILTIFSPCTLKDNNKTTLQYTIHDASLPWDVLFQKMEDIKTNHESLIEEYSIAETTLEEVFLTFARLQNPGKAPNVS